MEILILLIVVLISLILGFIVFRSNTQSVTNKLFLALSVSIALWSVVIYGSVNFSGENTLLWVRLTTFFAVPLATSFFLLSITIPNKKLGISSTKLYILLAFSMLTMAICISPFLFTGIQFTENSYKPIVGPGMALFGPFVNGIALLAIIILIRRYLAAVDVEKQQLGYVLLGISLLFGLIILTIFIPAAFFQSISFVSYGPLYALVFLGLTTYSILKHSLFNLKVIAAQVLTIILLVILFAKIFTSVSSTEVVVDILVFSMALIFGILLIKSVMNEVRQREKLEDLTLRLQEIDKQKDEFISMAAHELRSPLTAIKGYLSMIIEGDAGEITSKAREFLTDTSSVTERLIRLVNNMLNVSRIEEGRMVYQIEEESMIKVAEETFNAFRFEAERKNIKFILTPPDGLKHIVMADPDKLREILGNLVSNSIKYTQEGSVEIRLSNPTDKVVKVEVIDTGPGITVEEQAKLFQKFYRAQSTAGKTVGTGLGLYITKLLIEKFGGKIGLNSEPGKGSNFWFEIPVYTQGNEKNV